MITDKDQEDTEEKWHYIALKSEPTDNGYKKSTRSLSKLYRGITSNNHRDFYCLSCLHSYRTDNKLKEHEICNKHDYCDIRMLAEGNNTLKYNHREKSLRLPWAIYADFESLLIKKQSYQNNPEESYTEKKSIHESCGYSINLVSSFDSKQDKHSYYRGKDSANKFCEDLKKHTLEIINFKDKDMIPLTDKEIESYEKQKVCHICKKEFCYDKNEKNEFKIYKKVRDHCHYTGRYRNAAHNICNLRCKVQREIPGKIPNGSKYDYHLILRN